MTQHETKILQNKIIEEIRTTIGMENTGLIAPCECDNTLTLKLEKYYLSRTLLNTGYDTDKLKEILQ